MPAQVDIRQWYVDSTTSVLSQQLVTGLLVPFYASNDPIHLQYPIPIDQSINGGAVRYSYGMATRLYATTSPVTLINNIQWYAAPYGGDWVACSVVLVAPGTFYFTPTGTLHVTGTSLANFTGFSSVDINTYPSSTPLNVSGSLANPAVGDFGSFVYLQMVVKQLYVSYPTPTGITPGTKSAITITWAYDET